MITLKTPGNKEAFTSMIDFLQKFLDTVATYPERAAVVDKDGERSTSYKKAT